MSSDIHSCFLSGQIKIHWNHGCWERLNHHTFTCKTQKLPPLSQIRTSQKGFRNIMDMDIIFIEPSDHQTLIHASIMHSD